MSRRARKGFGIDYVPHCTCSSTALEPSEDCWIHGTPDINICPYCGQFRSPNKPCKRCGCDYGVKYIVCGHEIPSNALIDVKFYGYGCCTCTYYDSIRFIRKLYANDEVDPVLLLDSYRFDLSNEKQRGICFNMLGKKTVCDLIVVERENGSHVVFPERKLVITKVYN